MAKMVACNNPTECGVKQHALGSASYVECTNKSRANKRKVFVHPSLRKDKSQGSVATPPALTRQKSSDFLQSSGTNKSLAKMSDYDISDYSASDIDGNYDVKPKDLEPSFKAGEIAMRARENRESSRTETLKTYRDGSKLNMNVSRSEDAPKGSFEYEARPILELKDGTQIHFSDEGEPKNNINPNVSTDLSPHIDGELAYRDRYGKFKDDRLSSISEAQMRDVERNAQVYGMEFKGDKTDSRRMSVRTPGHIETSIVGRDGEHHMIDARFDLNR